MLHLEIGGMYLVVIAHGCAMASLVELGPLNEAAAAPREPRSAPLARRKASLDALAFPLARDRVLSDPAAARCSVSVNGKSFGGARRMNAAPQAAGPVRR